MTAEGADGLRAIIRREPKLTTHGFRWLVDGDHAVTFYDIGERFTVRDGLIEEIEAVFAPVPS